MGFKRNTYAAIDIGSNAMRLLIMDVNELDNHPPKYRKISLVRCPIRLGQDVFPTGTIGAEKQERMIDAMRAYRTLMDVYGIKHYKACATSAMRSAENRDELAETIERETGIKIDIIDGTHEAAMIALTDLHEMIREDRDYLYVDVGGGSTEMTLFSKGEELDSRSFKIGTVRMINERVDPELWQEAEQWVRKTCEPYGNIDMIGSGGNINNIFKSSGLSKNEPLSYLYISDYYDKLREMTYEERIYHLDKKQDRADVIIPAAEIYLSAMKWCQAKNIYVPKIGLADGIIKFIHNQLSEGKSLR